MKQKKSRFTVFAGHVRHFLKKNYRDNIPALSGQSAFFVLLSIVPMLLFVFSLYSILTGKDPENIARFKVPTASLGEGSRIIITLLRYVEDSVIRSSSGTTIVTAVIALWSAGKGIYYVTEGIGRVYQIPNKRFWIFKRIYAMGYTLLFLLMIMICTAVMVASFLLSSSLLKIWHETVVRWVMIVISYLILSVLLTLLLCLSIKLYLWRKIKNKRYYSVRALFPGVFVTVVAWNILTLGVMLYIRFFSTASVYGSLGTVVVLMLWLYYMGYILLCGVQLNYIYRGQFSEKGWFRRRKKEIKRLKAKKDADGT